MYINNLQSCIIERAMGIVTTCVHVRRRRISRVIGQKGNCSSVERKASEACLQCCSPLASSMEKQR